MFKLVAQGQCVLLSKLQVEARRDLYARLRSEEASGNDALCAASTRADFSRAVYCCTRSVDAGVLAVTAFNAQEERRFLIDRSANGPVVLDAMVRRNFRGERVAGIE